jgi:hypothetical protein
VPPCLDDDDAIRAPRRICGAGEVAGGGRGWRLVGCIRMKKRECDEKHGGRGGEGRPGRWWVLHIVVGVSSDTVLQVTKLRCKDSGGGGEIYFIS